MASAIAGRQARLINRVRQRTCGAHGRAFCHRRHADTDVYGFDLHCTGRPGVRPRLTHGIFLHTGGAAMNARFKNRAEHRTCGERCGGAYRVACDERGQDWVRQTSDQGGTRIA